MNTDRLKRLLLEKVAAPGGGAAAPAAKKVGVFGSKLFKNSPMAKKLTEGLAVFGGAGAALAAGGTAAAAATDAVVGPLKKKSYKSKMYKDNSWLKDENPKSVNKIFNTLFRFSPEMAADPQVAGSWVRKGLEFQDVGVQPTDVKTISEIEKNVSARKSNSPIKALFSPEELKNVSNITG